jgi:stage III sporulation protein AA
MLKKILPAKIVNIIEQKLNYEKLFELRFRSRRKISVNYDGKFYYLCEKGLSNSVFDGIEADKQFLNDIIVKASDYSLYTVNRNVCDGFITINGGIRIGIAGEYVWENGEIKTVKNFDGLTIRIPHEAKGCAEKLLRPLTDGGIHNSLIISPPGCGKTTMLRDMCRLISSLGAGYNVLLIDERCEIAASSGGIPQLDVGNNVDIISNCTKEAAILRGIRSMNPRVIITDELATKDDIEAVYAAVCCGVKVIASVHAADIYDLMNKVYFDRAIKHRLFTRYALLSDKPSIGTLSGIYDENFSEVYR